MASRMRVTVLHPNELGPNEANLWSMFQRTTPATTSPFLSLTFAQAVGRARPSARVAVIEMDGTIEGFLPFELAGPRVALPIGWPMSDVQGIVGSGAPIDPRWVVKNAGLRVWRFDRLPFEQFAFAPYQRSTFESPVMDLSNGYESYLKAVNDKSKSLTSTNARKRRALEREIGPVVFEWNSSRSEDFRRVIDWKTEQYRRTGGRELFSDPTALQIAEEVAASSAEDCSGIVHVLLVGERPIATGFNIMGPSGLSGWFPVYDPEFGDFSPGTMMHLALAEEASNRGVPQIDLGGGEQPYKLKLATGSHTLAKGAVYASRAEDESRKLYRRMRALRTRMREA
jgi:CelD/BcsL family acetyltransferase involved in cellulose biosynthesis